MRIKVLSLFTVTLLFVFLASCSNGGSTSSSTAARTAGSGDSGQQSSSNSGGGSSGSGGSSMADNSDERFEAGLARVSDLDSTEKAPFSNVGSDSLKAGRVELKPESDQNQVDVRIAGAAPSAAYDLAFCPFASGTSNCLAIGSVTTDDKGNAKAELAFPQSGTFAGVFLLSRAKQNEFLTAVSSPAAEELEQPENEMENSMNNPVAEPEDEEDHFEVSLHRVADVSGGLGSAFGSAGDDPLARGRVKVEVGDAEEGLEEMPQQQMQPHTQVQVQLKGAAASASYAVNFCPIGLGPSACSVVGSLTTNGEGDGEAELSASLQGASTGVLVLSRQIMGQNVNEFVTAVRVP